MSAWHVLLALEPEEAAVAATEPLRSLHQHAGGSLAACEGAAWWSGGGCYSDHNEDVRVKGSCDYCGGSSAVADYMRCPDCGDWHDATESHRCLESDGMVIAP